MKIIEHKELAVIQKILDTEPSLKCGYKFMKGEEFWYHKKCWLEFPTGELVGGLKVLALLGKNNYFEHCSLTKQDKFNAQGLEGKVRVQKSFISAYFNLRDILQQHRGRIVLPVSLAKFVKV